MNRPWDMCASPSWPHASAVARAHPNRAPRELARMKRDPAASSSADHASIPANGTDSERYESLMAMARTRPPGRDAEVRGGEPAGERQGMEDDQNGPDDEEGPCECLPGSGDPPPHGADHAGMMKETDPEKGRGPAGGPGPESPG